MKVASLLDYIKWQGSPEGCAVVGGKHAAMRGEAEIANPYAEGEPLHDLWLTGYRNWLKMAAFIRPALEARATSQTPAAS
jgi:hypothetical protein